MMLYNTVRPQIITTQKLLEGRVCFENDTQLILIFLKYVSINGAFTDVQVTHDKCNN